MKLKYFLHQISIRDFLTFGTTMDKARIGKRILYRVLGTQRHTEFISASLKEQAG